MCVSMCKPGQAKVLVEYIKGVQVVWWKNLALSVAWWPGTDEDIEEMVKECHQCQVNLNAPAAAPINPGE